MVLQQRAALDPRWAWQTYRPDLKRPWNLKWAGHLYRRAAFAANWQELQQAVRDGPEATVQRLLQPSPDQAAFDRQMDELAESIAKANNQLHMRAWWLARMLRTPFPLLEKMTLFWHNHFATSNTKVNNVGYMLQQNRTLRRYALGSFADMLQAISKDPAMMVWLDTNLSKKGRPNENYARELMELFSLGIGNYTEQDIREAARAFTGWEIRNGQFHFNRNEHDDGEKTVFGRTGRWQGEDIVRLCLEHPACPRFLARKLFRYFVSETLEPSPELLEPLAQRIRETNYHIGEAVRMILTSNIFYSEHAYRCRVKSPVEFAVGLIRALQGQPSAIALANALENVGQRLFYPPSVKGWDGGPAWLNSTTLLARNNLAQALTSCEDPQFGSRCDPVRVVRKYGSNNDEEVLDFFLDLFLQSDVNPEIRTRLADYLRQSAQFRWPAYWSEQDRHEHRIRALCYLVLSQPEFQLD
ncbi:MAG: DUF1800 domain-containing protein [Gemmatales bacterium]|nr:DUF1800 domain-containing protein [Gemmatales bacterium]